MSVNIKENNALTRVAGNAADLDKWIGTKAEWDALDHDTIPEGTEIIITDDEYPTKICRTVSECVDNTDENALAGASTVKEMNDNLTFPDGIGFYPDIKDGVRGYNTDAARGADTFHPFSSEHTIYECYVSNDRGMGSIINDAGHASFTLNGNWSNSNTAANLIITIIKPAKKIIFGSRFVGGDAKTATIYKNDVKLHSYDAKGGNGVFINEYENIVAGDIFKFAFEDSNIMGDYLVNVNIQ